MIAPRPDRSAEPDEQERDHQRTVRLPPARPWHVGSLLPWSVGATLGDPLMLLAPSIALVGLILAAVALSVPAEPEVLLPLMALPPADAYQDVAIVEFGSRGAIATWLLRAGFWALRTAIVGTLAALAVQRASGMTADLAGAWRLVGRRIRTVAFLELIAFGGFAATLVLRAGLSDARADGSVAAALFVGLLFLPGAFVAALTDELPAGTALRASLAWVRKRPLGHLALVALYAACLNGLISLADAGQVGPAGALPTTLLAFVAALVGVVFLAALARRHRLLYSAKARA